MSSNFQTFPAIAASPADTNFGDLSSGTNISAIMQVGTGAQIVPVNTGVIDANQLQGVPVTATPPTDLFALTYVAAGTDLEYLPLPVDLPAVSGQFVTAYAAATGLFTLGTPSSVVTTVPLAAQSAPIVAQALFTPTTPGLYRVSFNAKVTVPDAVSSVLGGTAGFTVFYTDATDATSSVTLQLNTPPATNSGNFIVSAATGSVLVNAAASPVTFSYDYTSGITPMQFQIQVTVEAV